jgi:hypothetical protein
MPATSAKQKKFFDAAAHNPAFAKAAGVPMSVAKEYSAASKGMTFKGGKERPDRQVINKPKTSHGKGKLFTEGGSMATRKPMPPFMGKESKAEEAMQKKKAPSKAAYKKAEMKMEGEKKYARGGGIEAKGKTKGKMVAMKRGGMCK